MFQLIKIIKQSFDSKEKSFQWLYFFVSKLPGIVGFEMRKWYFCKFAKSCGVDVIIWPEVKVRNIGKLELGKGVRLGERTMIQAAGGVAIGDHTIIGPSVKIWSVNHVYSDLSKPVLEQGYEYKKVVMGTDVWLGAASIIMPGTVLNDKTVVSAGSVVSAKEYPQGIILAGNPARKVGQRQ